MKVVFDTIVGSNRIAPISKRIMLANILNSFEFHSVKDEIVYKRRFCSVTGDTTFCGQVRELESSLNTSDDLYLVGVDGSKIGFSQLILSLVGKVVYVDFRGSGSPPCLRVMPAAAEADWLGAIKKHNIEGLNYRMTNLKVADIAKKLKIFEFPHYLIYDKGGKLLNERATGPNRVETEREIERYLL